MEEWVAQARQVEDRQVEDCQVVDGGMDIMEDL